MAKNDREIEPLPLDKGEAAVIGQVVKGIVSIVDTAQGMVDTVRMEDYLAGIRAQASRLGALPFPKTIASAANLEFSAKTFEAIIQLFKVRKEGREALEAQAAADAQMKKYGLI